MTPFIWCDRLVKVEGGCLMMSRAGDHGDWDMFPTEVDDDMPFAMNLGGPVTGAAVLPDGRLRIDGAGGPLALSGDRVTAMRVEGL